jgi:hypothetical protein
MSAIKRHAAAIAEQPTRDGYGFAISTTILLTVAEYVIPAIIKCWINNHATAANADHASDLKSIASAQWIASQQEYSTWILDQMEPQTRHALRRAGTRHPNEDEIKAYSSAILDDARLGNVEDIRADIGEVLTEVATVDLGNS